MASFIIDLIVFVYLGYSAFTGFKHGFLLSALALAGMLCSYLGAYLMGPMVGDFICDQYGSPRIISMVIGSMIVFFIIGLIFNMARNYIRFKNKKAVKQKDRKIQLSMTSRISGATIKFCVAFIMASLGVWGYSLLRVSPMKTLVPPINSSISAKVSRWVVAQGAYMIINELVPEKKQALQIANLVSRPEASLNSVNNIIKNPKIGEMLADESFINDLLSGDSDKILANEKFTAVMDDEALMEQVKNLDASSVTDSDEYKKQFAQKIANVGTKIKIFINDPEVKKNIESLKADNLLEAKNIKELMTDSRFMELADKFITKE